MLKNEIWQQKYQLYKCNKSIVLVTLEALNTCIYVNCSYIFIESLMKCQTNAYEEVKLVLVLLKADFRNKTFCFIDLMPLKKYLFIKIYKNKDFVFYFLARQKKKWDVVSVFELRNK